MFSVLGQVYCVERETETERECAHVTCPSHTQDAENGTYSPSLLYIPTATSTLPSSSPSSLNFRSAKLSNSFSRCRVTYTHTHTHVHFIHPQSTSQTVSLSNTMSNRVKAHPWYSKPPVWAAFPWKQSPTDQQQRRSRIEETSDASFPSTPPELFHIQTT